MQVQSKRVLAGLVVALSLMSSGAFASGEVAAGITAAQTEITGYIGLAITAAFALLTLSLAPDVGLSLVKKWIRKGAK